MKVGAEADILKARGSGKSDRGISGGSVLRQPKMAEQRSRNEPNINRQGKPRTTFEANL